MRSVARIARLTGPDRVSMLFSRVFSWEAIYFPPLPGLVVGDASASKSPRAYWMPAK